MKKMLLTAVSVFCVYVLSAQQVYTERRTCSEIYFARPAIWTSTAWQNTVADDNKYISTIPLRGGTTWPIQFSRFGFAIPSNAIIQGIDVTVIRHKTGKNNVRDSYAALVTGNDFANSGGNVPNHAKTDYWTTRETSVVYTFAPSGIGSDGNPYNYTATEINKPYFGLFYDIGFLTGGAGSAAHIEKVSIAVRYTLSTTVASNLQLTPVDKSVVATADEKGTYNLAVRDLNGRLVQRAILKDPENTTVYLNNKMPGLYLISLEGATSKKVIKAFIR
jgi:hypothetical protein